MSIFSKSNKCFCPRCGYANSADSRYCGKCGHALPVRQYVSGAQTSYVTGPQYQNSPEFRPQADSGFESYDDYPPNETVPKAVFVSDAAMGSMDYKYGEDDWDGETMVLDDLSPGDDETTILGDEAMMPAAYLIREDTGERIGLTKQQFVIGRSSEGVDYTVSDRTVISRRHAAIVLEAGRFLVVDLGSSNKTYLDEMEIAPGGAAELFSGSRIRLADLEFTFYIG